MWEEFDLEVEEGKLWLRAYLWPVNAPEQVAVIVHGIGEYAGRYDRVAGFLNQANIAVLSMDLRGHGKSPGKRGHGAPRNKVLSDVDCLMVEAEKRYRGVPIILYGHSMGANMVLDYRVRGLLANRPVAYLVTAPWIFLVKPIPPILKKMAGILSKIVPSAQFRSNIDASVLGNQKSVGEYTRDPLVHGFISAETAHDGFSIADQLAKGTLTGPFLAKGKPLLILHGTQDRLCDVEGARRVFSHEDATRSRLEELPGIYHEVHNGGPESDGEEIIYKIRDYMKTHTA